ncbi:hypothetical protein DWW31_06625 [Clostridium sp. AF15-17LB]|nr:hypothetical protein DWW31_06625 [Clostridium sp. AF15-17LB]
MDMLKKIAGSTAGRCIIVAVILIAAFVIHNELEGQRDRRQAAQEKQHKPQRDVEYASQVESGNKILNAFEDQFPEAEVILACEEDVTDDGNKDLVVIYKEEGLTRTVTVIDSGDGVNYTFTAPIPGPIENQKIQFKNIDKEGEIEIIVTGEKNGAVGYAIYRIIDGEMVDLFGEGMEDCC